MKSYVVLKWSGYLKMTLNCLLGSGGMLRAFCLSKVTSLLIAGAFGNLVATTSLRWALRGVHEALVHAVNVCACATIQLTDRVTHFPVIVTIQHKAFES
jgi:hypothetical protein